VLRSPAQTIRQSNGNNQGRNVWPIPTPNCFNGKWRPGQAGRTIAAVLNPATEDVIGTVAHADRADLDEALEAAAKGFKVWRAVAPFDRCKIMRKAAAIMRERNDEIAPLLTMEQGKTLAEAKMEAMAAADVIEWFAEEAKARL
jgi:succinate-semialdehyde dehydrogenase/glutarate-semialdehyde dehydrogenase